MSSKKPLVHTTEEMVKEGIDDMETQFYVVEKSINHHKEKNKIDAINEIDKPQAYQSKRDKSIRNESNKGMSVDKSSSLDNSRSSERIEIEDTVKPLNKSRSISSASLSDKSTENNNQNK